MKKTLLLALMAVFAFCANAQEFNNTDWYFDPSQDIEVGDYSEDFTKGIFTFECNGKTWQVDENKARFYPDTTTQYTHRIKAKSKSNKIRIEAPSAGTIVFATRTGSNSDYARTLVATQNGTELYNHIVCEDDTIAHDEGAPRAYYTHTVDVPAAGTVEITMPTGNLNYYFIGFTDQDVDNPNNPGEEPGDDPEVPGDDPELPIEEFVLNPAVIGENTFDTSYTYGIYTLVVVPGTEETKPWVIDANKAKYSHDPSVQFTHRMKPGGAQNYIEVNVPEAGTLLICPRSSNSSDTDRTMVVTQNDTELLNVIVADEQAVDKVYPAHEVAISNAGVVKITNPVNALNYYYVEFTSSAGLKYNLDFSQLVMKNNVVEANGAERVMIYDTTGRLVRVVNSDEADLNRAARGIYIVKAVYANGESAILKVRR